MYVYRFVMYVLNSRLCEIVYTEIVDGLLLWEHLLRHFKPGITVLADTTNQSYLNIHIDC